ncbi:hypothetical protein SLA2020_365730 [Shorea laevis]
MFGNYPKRSSLSCSFYMGNTFVRLLPHAYDLYRAHKYVHHHNGSYIYANPGADFYSSTWDVVIPLEGLLFALIIYLQQRFGGRCIFPRRFRELGVYERCLSLLMHHGRRNLTLRRCPSVILGLFARC